MTVLKAEHNRWWAERLLGDWRFMRGIDCKIVSKRLHPDLKPFDQLKEGTKDYDKVCIAAMARQGFIEV
jgi:hypothetical protein